ncbi:MAG: SDR family NAD(P)-dependent oxidoreductase [Actinomycetia bacterium]|nr:SDR family NAD(P)-dependent oxidoreductase [Actinomycetes bacterium]MCP4957846.1 SDR family NAD(P)-dependent oxidoreductase [Actinomycetes bacterium]
MELAGKTALVTGAASGIGFAMSRRFGEAGMTVVMADIEADTLDVAATQLADDGAKIEAVICDVRSDESVKHAVEVAVGHGGLHVLCNNAGVSGGGQSWNSTEEDWQWVIDVNLHGVARGVRHGVPVMIEQGEGHVVNTSSMAGITAMPSTAVYSASKHAVVAMTEILNHDLAVAGHSGIGVSVLCPGWVVTNLMESERNRPGGPRDVEDEDVPEVQAAFREAVVSAFNRGKSPDEIAQMVHDAVVDNRFWIITHDDWFPGAVGRAKDLVDQRNPEVRFWPM